MSRTSPLLVRKWAVGRFGVELSVAWPSPNQPVFVSVVWTPHEPNELTESELQAYRIGRDAALVDVAIALGADSRLELPPFPHGQVH